jgi:hypothetical protein
MLLINYINNLTCVFMDKWDKSGLERGMIMLNYINNLKTKITRDFKVGSYSNFSKWF